MEEGPGTTAAIPAATSRHAKRKFEAAEKDARAPAAERRLTRCRACWNPQFGRFRLIQHTYNGDCKFTPPSPTAAASTASEAATAAAMAISLPQSQGLLFGSVMSDTEEPPLAKVQEKHPPAVTSVTASQSEGVGQSGRETARQPGVPLDRLQRRDGNLPTALQLRLPPPLQPVLQP